MQPEPGFLPEEDSELDDELSVDSFFVNLVRDNMAVLTAAIHCDGGLSPQNATKLAEAMANIGHTAEAMGYPIIRAMLDSVSTEFPRAGKNITPKRRTKIAAKLSQTQSLIRDMICLVETGAI